MRICALIPAAGRGTRLGSDTPKILVPIDDNGEASSKRTVWSILRQTIAPFVNHIHVVVSNSGYAQFESVVSGDSIISVSIQPEPIGMGDAIFGAYEHWRHYDYVLIVWGDQVNLSPQTIDQVAALCQGKKRLVLPLTGMETPYVQYDFDGPALKRIRQSREGDATDPFGRSDVGVFALSVENLEVEWREYLNSSPAGAATGELNFLPFLVFLSKHGWEISVVDVKDNAEARGINTPDDLQFARNRLL